MTYPNRSAYVKSPWQFEVRDNPVLEPGPGQVVVDVGACSLCGTDLHIAHNQARDWQPFGHEIAGVVRAVGPDITRLRPGHRVALDCNAACGKCDACTPKPLGRGRPELCPNAVSFWGSPTMGFGDRLLTPHQNVMPIPDSLPFDVACLTEPLGVSMELVKAAEVGPGDHVLVVGPGPLGLMAVFLARRAGAERVYLAGFSYVPNRLEAGRALGADAIIRIDETPLCSYDFGRQPDKVLSTAPPATLPESIAVAALGGTVSYIGIAWDETRNIQVDADYVHFRKLTLRGAHPCPGMNAPECVSILTHSPELAQTLVTHRFTLDELPAMMQYARDERAGVIKAVMENPGTE